MVVDSNNIKQCDGFCFEGFLFGKSYAEASEYVRNGIEKEGVSFIKKLNGNFCAYYLNGEKQELYVFNDRLAMFDLHLLKAGDAWFISDDYWTAVDYLSSYTVNDMAIRQLLAFGYMLWGNTYLSEIELCEPATLITIDLNTSRIKKTETYWTYQPNTDLTNRKKAKKQMVDAIIKGVDESFNESESEYFVANSGGLDSRWNMYCAKALGKEFTAYTYAGKIKSDAIYISEKVNKALKHNNAKYIQISTGDYMPNYADIHMEKAPMISAYSMWYFDAYKSLSEGQISINGFASTFADAFTYMDDAGRYNKYWNAPKSEKYMYCFDTYCTTDRKLIETVCKKAEYKDMEDDFIAQLAKSDMNALEDICDTFDFDCRQRRLNKNEPWSDFYGKMQSRSPLTHNDMVDLSLQLPFDMRHDRSVYKEAAQDVMGHLSEIRFERSPQGLSGNRAPVKKLKELIWRADMKMYKKTGCSIWFRGNHKNVSKWMSEQDNIAFLREVFSTKNAYLSERFNQEYLLNNLQQLIKSNFIFVSSLLTVFLFFIRLEKSKMHSIKQV